MATDHLVSDELILPKSPVQASHPTDSSRLLLGLIALSHYAERPRADGTRADSLEGIISREVLRSLLSALNYRDAATIRHTRQVAMLAVGIARYLNWEDPELKLLEVAALLHDIGKIGVPDNILFKPGKLSADEADLMALHHNIGVDVLQAARVNKEVLQIIVQAHSRFSKTNNGHRQVGGDVHQGARILAVADAYDSLATDKVYRKGKSHDEIMSILRDASGRQFDGNVVATLARFVEREGLPYGGPTGETGGSSDEQAPPAHSEEALEASSLCHIFSYLYVLESLYDGFYLVDTDLRFVVWSRGAEQLLAYPAGKMLRQQWSSRLLRHRDSHGESLTDQQYPLNQVIATGEATTSTVQMQHAGGHWVQVELQSVPLMDRMGRLQGVAEIFRDLTRNGSRPQEYRELKMAASRDPLTSAANRGELETQLALMLSEFAKQADPEPVSVIFLDVDFFKHINDTYGHTVGDQVLVDVARLLQHETYSGELIGRYGGEEFVILCPGTDLEQAFRRAERLRIAVANTDIGGLTDYRVTVSFGVAEVERGDSVESILRRADKALYRAKATGRNRTCSLTTQELLQGESSDGTSQNLSSEPFVYTATFRACIAADMIVYKLGGFVDDRQAKLTDVTRKRAVIRLGNAGLLPVWGRSDERQPVEIVVEFGDEQRTNQASASKQVDVTARIRPLGWVRSSEVFQNRAKYVMKDLRSYFVAD